MENETGFPGCSW